MAAPHEDAHRTLRDQGREIMTEVLGAPYVARRDDSTNDFNAPIRRLSEEFAYASLWTRGTLSRRERSLITLGMLCALNRPPECATPPPGPTTTAAPPERSANLFTPTAPNFAFPPPSTR